MADKKANKGETAYELDSSAEVTQSIVGLGDFTPGVPRLASELPLGEDEIDALIDNEVEGEAGLPLKKVKTTATRAANAAERAGVADDGKLPSGELGGVGAPAADATDSTTVDSPAPAGVTADTGGTATTGATGTV